MNRHRAQVVYPNSAPAGSVYYPSPKGVALLAVVAVDAGGHLLVHPQSFEIPGRQAGAHDLVDARDEVPVERTRAAGTQKLCLGLGKAQLPARLGQGLTAPALESRMLQKGIQQLVDARLFYCCRHCSPSAKESLPEPVPESAPLSAAACWAAFWAAF